MIAKYKKSIIVSSIIIIVFLFILGVPSNLRYKYEKTFSKPSTFFYNVHLATIVDDSGYYEDEYSLDDTHEISIPEYKGSIEYYLYGKFVNSADYLVVILNDKVIYNSSAQRNSNDVFSRYYIESSFVVNLKGFIHNKKNEIIISTGNKTEKYVVK